MSSLRVRVLTSDWTAHLLAVVLLTLLEGIADSLALQVVNLIHLFLCHEVCALVVRIVDLIAGELSLCFVADAALVDHLFAQHALIVVALLDALVSPAG